MINPKDKQEKALSWFTREGSAVYEGVVDIDLKNGRAKLKKAASCRSCDEVVGRKVTCKACKGEPFFQETVVYTQERLRELNFSLSQKRAKNQETMSKGLENEIPQQDLSPSERLFIEQRFTNNKFLASLKSRIDASITLTPKQLFAFREHVKRELEKSTSLIQVVEVEKKDVPSEKWVGTVGEKITIQLKVESITDISRISEDQIVPRFRYLCKDSEGNSILYFGKAKTMPLEGESAEIEAFIKDHTNWKGFKQTVIERPMFAKKK